MRLAPAALLLPLAACISTAPISYTALTPEPAESAYACAVRKVNELGYTVKSASKDAAFVTGEKQTSGAVVRALTGSDTHDQITVSVFDGAAGQRTIRVTAGSTSDKANLFGNSTAAKEPSETGKADANSILMACAKGPISTQPTPPAIEYSAEAR